MIDFKQEWFAAAIQDYIEPKELESHETFSIGGLARPIIMTEFFLASQHRFYDDVLDLKHEPLGVDSISLHSLDHGL